MTNPTMTAQRLRGPVARSLTRRRAVIAEAKRSVRKYSDLTGLPTDQGPEFEAQAHHARVSALLWAIARLERVLWLETSGQFGDEVATPRRIVSRVIVHPGVE